MLCHNWPSCDPHFLCLLAFYKQHSILRLPSYFYYAKDSMQKYEHKVKGKRTSVWSKESFLKLGIWFWTKCVCLCIWKISLLLRTCICSWVLQLMREGNLWVNYEYFNVLVVTLCKPVVYKLKILMEENLNINQCKSMGKTTKKGGGVKSWYFSGGKQRKVNTIFGSNLVEGNIGGKLKKPFLCANANMNKDSSIKQ